MAGRYQKGAWLLAFVLIATTLCSFNVAANPSTYRVAFSSPLEGIGFLFLVNLPIDAFLIATALYFVYRACGPDAGRIPRNSGLFVVKILAASVMVAVIGAILDFYLFYDPHPFVPDSYAFWFAHEDAFFGSPEFFMALAGVFISLYAAMILLVRLDWRLSFLVAVAIATINPLAWIITTSDSRFLAFMMAVLFAVFAFVSFTVLAYWHSHAFDDEALLGDHIHTQSEKTEA